MTRFERKMKLWKILHNKIPHCPECQYWPDGNAVNRMSCWCRKHKKFPRENKEIKSIGEEENKLIIFDDNNATSINICEKFK